MNKAEKWNALKKRKNNEEQRNICYGCTLQQEWKWRHKQTWKTTALINGKNYCWECFLKIADKVEVVLENGKIKGVYND